MINHLLIRITKNRRVHLSVFESFRIYMISSEIFVRGSRAYSGHIPVLLWNYSGTILEMFWTCSGHILVIFWLFSGYFLLYFSIV